MSEPKLRSHARGKRTGGKTKDLWKGDDAGNEDNGEGQEKTFSEFPKPLQRVSESRRTNFRSLWNRLSPPRKTKNTVETFVQNANVVGAKSRRRER